MRYIDLALIDKKDPDVIGWLNKARLYLNELSKKTTHDERKEYMALMEFGVNSNRYL